MLRDLIDSISAGLYVGVAVSVCGAVFYGAYRLFLLVQ